MFVCDSGVPALISHLAVTGSVDAAARAPPAPTVLTLSKRDKKLWRRPNIQKRCRLGRASAPINKAPAELRVGGGALTSFHRTSDTCRLSGSSSAAAFGRGSR